MSGGPVDLDAARAARVRADVLTELGSEGEPFATWAAGESRRRRLRSELAQILEGELDDWPAWKSLDPDGRAALLSRLADDLDAYRAFRGQLEADDVARTVDTRLGVGPTLERRQRLAEVLFLRVAKALEL